MHSVELNDEILQKQDCVIILTAHSNIDYRRLLKHSKMVIDTRNVLSGIDDDKIIKA
jgi:UDP-N-acetyl-D-glucosamine dehydrogenase